jgi:geranylgeranyl transferase type-1 subunit beta
MNPDLEAQGGVTFCGIASLVLSARLASLTEFDMKKLLHWLVSRQQRGFQGRTNKDPDTCYAFWNGATLDMLGHHDLVDISECRGYVLSCQHRLGGFSKYPNVYPDVMHTYYGLAWLSIAGIDGLTPIDSKLQLPVMASNGNLPPKRLKS